MPPPSSSGSSLSPGSVVVAPPQHDAHDAHDHHIAAARYHDYRHASNPLSDGMIGEIPLVEFGADLHQHGGTRIVPLDNAAVLGCSGPATSPGLCANFVRIRGGEALVTDANTTSQLLFVMRGTGTSSAVDADGPPISWKAGDLFTLPARSRRLHAAHDDAALYWVHDEPLLRYLGVEATQRQFTPTLYRREAILEALEAVVRDPSSATANRLSVLLGNRLFPGTKTITHVLWAMFGLLPVGADQAPHRHQSVALDLVVDAQPGCYTMVGRTLAADGSIKDARRIDWQPHAAFVTPPGLWHSHHNQSGQPAHILPIQDAGLHTFLRTLNILFSRRRPDGTTEVADQAG